MTDVDMGAAYQGRASESQRIRGTELAAERLERRCSELAGQIGAVTAWQKKEAERQFKEIRRLQRRLLVMEAGYVQLTEAIRLMGEGVLIISDAARTHAEAARQRLDTLERDVTGDAHE